MVDAHVSGACVERHAGSSPVLGTKCGNSSVGRAQPCQGWGREFESRFPLFLTGCSNGGIGRHEGLKIPWPVMAVRVQVPLRVRLKSLIIICLDS